MLEHHNTTAVGPRLRIPFFWTCPRSRTRQNPITKQGPEGALVEAPETSDEVYGTPCFRCADNTTYNAPDPGDSGLLLRCGHSRGDPLAYVLRVCVQHNDMWRTNMGDERCS